MLFNPGKQLDSFIVKTKPDKSASLSRHKATLLFLVTCKPRLGGLIINPNTKIVCIYPQLNITTNCNQKQGIA